MATMAASRLRDTPSTMTLSGLGMIGVMLMNCYGDGYVQLNTTPKLQSCRLAAPGT